MPRLRRAVFCIFAAASVIVGWFGLRECVPAKAFDDVDVKEPIVQVQDGNKTIVIRKARANEKPSDSLSDVCRSTPHAEFVFYQGCPVTEDDVAALFLLQKLRKVILCGSSVGEASIKQVARLPELRELKSRPVVGNGRRPASLRASQKA